jgi:predicted secreted protein
MKLSTLKNKKSLKIVTLLIASLLIASASAQVYRYMYINGTVTVGTAILSWSGGSVTPSIAGTTATITLNVEEDVPINFTDALYLTNNDNTNSYNYTISVLTALSGTDFTTAKIHVYETNEATGPYVDTLI